MSQRASAFGFTVGDTISADEGRLLVRASLLAGGSFVVVARR
jgi:hypothetical protein